MNSKNYIDALDRNKKINDKDELLTLSLTEETLKKLKKIKNSMEWNTDSALNSILTFFFKVLNYKNKDEIKQDLDKKVKEIKFSPTIKNEERINKYLKDNTHNFIIELSINTFYQRLITFDSHE